MGRKTYFVLHVSTEKQICLLNRHVHGGVFTRDQPQSNAKVNNANVERSVPLSGTLLARVNITVGTRRIECSSKQLPLRFCLLLHYILDILFSWEQNQIQLIFPIALYSQ